MNRLDVYVGRSVLAATALAWAAVASLETVLVLLGELKDVGRGTYSLSAALKFALLTLPARAYPSFAMAALIGVLLGVGGLAAQRELDAFRLAGCSPARLARAVMQAGAAMLAAAVLLGEGWGPPAERLARQLRAEALFDGVELGVEGFWLRDGVRLIQVGHSAADGSLAAVRVFELDATPRLVSATHIARARYRDGGWVLDGVSSSEFGPRGVEVRVAARAVWPHLVDPRLVPFLARHPQTLSLTELRTYTTSLREVGGSVGAYELSFWRRLAEPVTAAAMLLLAAGLVLGPLARQGAGQRMLIAVLAGLALKLANEIVAHAGLVYGAAPWLAAFAPSGVLLAGGLWLLRGRSWRPPARSRAARDPAARAS